MPIYAPTGFLDVTNATLRGSKIVTTSNVGVANVNPLNTLSVGSNLQVEDTGSNVLTVRGNAAAAAMTLGVITLAPSYSLEIVSNIGNTVSNTIQFTNETTGFVSESNIEVGTGNLFVNTSTGLVSVGNALSVSGRADLTDLHASNLTVDGALYANASTGRVGVNTTSPGNFNLDVHGSANVGALTATDVTVTGNLAVAGELTSIRSTTVNVDDPIIGLANNNTSDPAVLDIGFVMARPSTATGSNVAIIFDESSDTLEIGYTTGKHTDTTITIDDSVLFHTNIHGNVAVSNLEVGQFSVAAAYGLDHVTNENNSTGDTIISTNGTTGLQTTANVSVGRDALVSGNVEVSKELTVSGNTVVSQELTVNGNLEVSKELTVSGNVEVSKELTVSGNVEVGTANLFVDTVTGNVGIGTVSPTGKLQIRSDPSSISATDTDSLISNAAINISSHLDPNDYLSIGLLGATYSPEGNNPSAYMQVQWDTNDSPLTSSLLLNPIGGKVGIGTTDPGATLDVQGSVNLHSLLPSASGGTETQITDDGISYKVHSFTTIGTTQITVSKGGFFECLVVAGGGAGGKSNGSGGGAGGVVIQQVFVNAGTYDVIVGAGNTNGDRNPGFLGARTYAEYPTGYRGENSSVFGLVAIGGGNGGGDDYCGVDGGSGGGCADDYSVIPGRSVQNQEGSNGYGNRGGYARFNASAGSGGGGAGEPGYDCDPDRFLADANSSWELLGRDGGNGVGSTIRTGSIQYYGGGGGGAQRTTAPSDQPGAGIGGKGGGGNGASANNAGSAGSPNTGGGGGGSSSGTTNGGNGGSGIVVVRYKT